MPQKSIPVDPGGSNTPTKVTNPVPAVNTQMLARLAEDELLCWVDKGTTDLNDLAVLLGLIVEMAEAAPINEGRNFDIGSLARIGKRVAADTANSMDCSQADYRRQLEVWGLAE